MSLGMFLIGSEARVSQHTRAAADEHLGKFDWEPSHHPSVQSYEAARDRRQEINEAVSAYSQRITLKLSVGEAVPEPSRLQAKRMDDPVLALKVRDATLTALIWHEAELQKRLDTFRTSDVYAQARAAAADSSSNPDASSSSIDLTA